ncbi:MAG: hypothetical protein V4850_01120 [Myxococcota bacterium]
MARTLAEHGTWGINAGEFASATSSPLYTAILALGLGAFGAHEQVSLFLNVAAGAVVCWLVAAFARDLRDRATSLAFVLVCGPLPYLASLGMEHVLHAALVLALALVGLAAPFRNGRFALLALAVAGVLTRYETLFVLAPLMMLLARRGRWMDGLLVGGAGALAVGTYGAWSWSQGGLVIPNSILMKSALAGGWETLWKDNLYEGAPVLLLVAGAAAAAAVDRRQEGHALLFGVAALLHLAFARIGWLYRYEGYLIIWGGVIAVPPLLRAVKGPQLLLLAAILIPSGFRAWRASVDFVAASRCIHDNDVVLAKMVARDLPDVTLAVHNIGALAWFSDATVVDVAGLATDEVTRLHLGNQLTGQTFGSLLARRGVQLAYTDVGWLAADPPPGLEEIAVLSYQTPVPGRRAKTRLSITPLGDVARLSAALRSLPPGGDRYSVEWSIVP